MDLNRCTRAVSTQHGLHNLPTPPQTGVETGTFRPHPSTQLLFVALFSPVGLPRAPSHIDEWPFIITSSLEHLALCAL